ncbi:hypothetical protein D3C71_1846430 [compost metagenome]
MSKVGLALLLAIASTSFSCWAMPASKAGAKSLSLILSNCGKCSGSGLSAKNGLACWAVVAAGVAAVAE